MKNKNIVLSLLAAVFLGSACNNPPKAPESTEKAAPALTESLATYRADSVEMKGYVSYDTSSKDKRPIVMIVHEWWGLNDYAKKRARQLAEMGYLAFAVDMFGNGRQGNNPAEADALARPFYKDPAMARRRFDAAVAMAKTYSVADTSKVLAIGYCFGGSMVLNMARLGEDLDGVVSFHGNLAGVAPDKSKLKSKVLVCHGADDKFVSAAELETFKKQMDSIGANYTFKSYQGATHAFSNPAATENGKKFNIPIAYNAQADTASWNDMKVFFGTVFK